MTVQEIKDFADHAAGLTTNLVGQEDGSAGGKFDVQDILALGGFVGGQAQGAVDMNSYNISNLGYLYAYNDLYTSGGNIVAYSGSISNGGANISTDGKIYPGYSGSPSTYYLSADSEGLVSSGEMRIYSNLEIYGSTAGIDFEDGSYTESLYLYSSGGLRTTGDLSTTNLNASYVYCGGLNTSGYTAYVGTIYLGGGSDAGIGEYSGAITTTNRIMPAYYNSSSYNWYTQTTHYLASVDGGYNYNRGISTNCPIFPGYYHHGEYTMKPQGTYYLSGGYGVPGLMTNGAFGIGGAYKQRVLTDYNYYTLSVDGSFLSQGHIYPGYETTGIMYPQTNYYLRSDSGNNGLGTNGSFTIGGYTLSGYGGNLQIDGYDIYTVNNPPV